MVFTPVDCKLAGWIKRTTQEGSYDRVSNFNPFSLRTCGDFADHPDAIAEKFASGRFSADGIGDRTTRIQPLQGVASVSHRGNEYDVSYRFNATEPAAINAEVDRIFLDLYPRASTARIDQAFCDLAALYRGEYPGFHACDTSYHDIQHVLSVTLAMARLLDGYERGKVGRELLDASIFNLGIVTALFHDCGYVRKLDDTTHNFGGELTLTHVSRGAHFLMEYLPKIGMGEVAGIAAALLHFTGYEMPVAQIKVPSLSYKLLGSMLGTADIIAQMSDRCYLEKCRDRLYPEFVAGGIARKHLPNGEVEVLYESGEDLVMKTPRFYEGAIRRLDAELDGCHKHAERHFGGQHLYLDEVKKNIRFARTIGEENGTSSLKRKPPDTLAGTPDKKV